LSDFKIDKLYKSKTPGRRLRYKSLVVQLNTRWLAYVRIDKTTTFIQYRR